MNQLFDRLPDRLFSPLASANRRIYGTLLLDIYPLFFDQVHLDVFPSRDTVRQEIEERLEVMAAAWQEEPDTALGQLPPEQEGTPAAQAYRRLLSAGWIEEETEGYRVRVTVPPAVGTLWGSLMEIARPDRVFYGGMVLSIFNNVQKAWEEPEPQVLALRQAAREARRFLQHLHTMIYGLKGLLGDLSGCDDHRRILSRFFDDFVERILVQDYKRLKTRNNPFRYRQLILQRVRELEYDHDRRRALVAGYLDQTGESDSEKAWELIDDDIRRLRDVFERLDGHLERVDRFRSRVERRVADTVRYLDRTQPGMPTRIAGILQGLGPLLQGLEDGEPGPLPLPVIDVLPVGPQSLREAPRHRRPPEPRPLVSRPIDPAMQERQRALRAYLDRRRIDPKRIALYLERQLAGRDRIDGAAMKIESVEDFIAFTHVRHLGYLPGAGRLRQDYLIEHSDGQIDNQWLRCPSFSVQRRRPARERAPMLRDLRQACERPGNAEPEDFRSAARAVLTRQFLVLERPRDRDFYRLIVNHFDYFSNLFDALGWTLHRDDDFGLIGLLPGDAEGFRHLRLVDSLMLLCLRLVYEEGLERFEVRDGSVYAQSETLLGRYETLLGRKRPPLTEYRETLRRLRRYSLIETGDETDDGLPVLRILPTVRLVTGEQVLTRIQAFVDSAIDSCDAPDEDAADRDDPKP